MAKMKINLGTPSSPNWIELDAKNGDTVDGIHFRVNNGIIQYSIDGSTWYNAGAIGTATTGDVLSGKTFSSSAGTNLVGTMPNKSGQTISDNSSDTANVIEITPSGSQWPDGWGGTLKIKPRVSGYIDSNTIIQQNIYGLHPSVVKEGQTIGANSLGGGTFIKGTYAPIPSYWNGNLIDTKMIMSKSQKWGSSSEAILRVSSNKKYIQLCSLGSATSGGQVKVLDMESGNVVTEYNMFTVAFPTRRRLGNGIADDGTYIVAHYDRIIIRDLAGNNNTLLPATAQNGTEVCGASMSPNGQWIAVCSEFTSSPYNIYIIVYKRSSGVTYTLHSQKLIGSNANSGLVSVNNSGKCVLLYNSTAYHYDSGGLLNTSQTINELYSSSYAMVVDNNDAYHFGYNGGGALAKFNDTIKTVWVVNVGTATGVSTLSSKGMTFDDTYLYVYASDSNGGPNKVYLFNKNTGAYVSVIVLPLEHDINCGYMYPIKTNEYLVFGNASGGCWATYLKYM